MISTGKTAAQAGHTSPAVNMMVKYGKKLETVELAPIQTTRIPIAAIWGRMRYDVYRGIP